MVTSYVRKTRLKDSKDTGIDRLFNLYPRDYLGDKNPRRNNEDINLAEQLSDLENSDEELNFDI